MTDKYHSGEIYIQEYFGEESIANGVIRIVKETIVGGAIPFVENQVAIFVSSIDTNGNTWISMLIGSPGFIDASTSGEVYFNLEHLVSPHTDVFFENIKSNRNIGIIFIELGSRRRYRVNGQADKEGQKITLNIEAAYPNCPKYIQRRILSSLDKTQSSRSIISHGTDLNDDQKGWILKADTFLVGSQSKEGKPDASHRGGNSGFIEILDNGTLKIPDYAGNSMYNTLGNMFENPNVGLVFIDFDQGHILQLSGEAQLLFDQHTEADKLKTTDTGRYWLFEPKQWIQTNAHHSISWEFIDNSPYNPNDK